MPIADKETTTPTDEISVGEAIYSEVIIGEEEWRQKKNCSGRISNQVTVCQNRGDVLLNRQEHCPFDSLMRR
jgi:hypothetical protein